MKIRDQALVYGESTPVSSFSSSACQNERVGSAEGRQCIRGYRIGLDFRSPVSVLGRSVADRNLMRGFDHGGSEYNERVLPLGNSGSIWVPHGLIGRLLSRAAMRKPEAVVLVYHESISVSSSS